MSDLSGQEIETHANSESQVIFRLRDWLNAGRGEDRPLPGGDAIHSDYETYLKIVPTLIASQKLDNYERLSHADFLWTVYDVLRAMEMERATRRQ
jgi:hypothetical protein